LTIAATVPVVRAAGLALRYGRTQALAGVTFTLSSGVTGLLGPNGAGKTTLLRVVATALVPDHGELAVFGADPRTGAGRLAARRRLGYLPQDPGFHPGFTAFEFVDYVAILKELTNRRDRHEQVRAVLEAVGLRDQRGKKIRALSGGMRQRVALAAALVGDPELLVLDEPTVGLDPEQRLRFRDAVSTLADGRCVVVSTHQTEDVAALCPRVVVLHEGEIRYDGSPSGLAARADGRVWTAADRQPGAVVAWRSENGGIRQIGVPPVGSELVRPTLEDGYLLLVGGAGNRQEVPA
jgi:ABC-2 type transport system ATP-binding protein